jgi:hypothetical protein
MKHTMVDGVRESQNDIETQYWMRWDYMGWNTLNQHGVGPDGDGPEWGLWTQTEWFRKLYNRLYELHTWIFRSTQTAPYLVTVSPEILTILEQLPTVAFTVLNPIAEGPAEIGSINGMFILRLDYYQRHNRMYVGTEDNYKLGCIDIDNLHQYGDTQEN